VNATLEYLSIVCPSTLLIVLVIALATVVRQSRIGEHRWMNNTNPNHGSTGDTAEHQPGTRNTR
jgi:hypothetical protein